MKTNQITHRVRRLTLALAVSLSAFALASPARGQFYKPTGDDGITASPKVRAQLNERKARIATPAPAVATMACPKCKDQYVTVPVKGAKGGQILMAGGIPTQKIAKHLCPGCDTTISVAGVGKAKHDVAIHKCDSCGSENLACCSTSGAGNVATKGMEKKSVQIAPIK